MRRLSSINSLEFNCLCHDETSLQVSHLFMSSLIIFSAIMRMLTVQPDLITDKEYLEHSIKYAIDCGVIDQWILGRVRGYPPVEGMEEDITPDPYGIKSITETEYRTILEPLNQVITK